MDWKQGADIAATLGPALSLGAGAWALLEYRGAKRTRRAEWLATLHQQFFDVDRYALIRRVLDYRTEPHFTQLQAAVCSQSAHPLADELYRYLNFFEFLVSLRDLRQITPRELRILFRYDLRLIAEHAFILEALRPQDFERLDRWYREEFNATRWAD